MFGLGQYIIKKENEIHKLMFELIVFNGSLHKKLCTLITHMYLLNTNADFFF